LTSGVKRANVDKSVFLWTNKSLWLIARQISKTRRLLFVVWLGENIAVTLGVMI
jgi:hypothetical protein